MVIRLNSKSEILQPKADPPREENTKWFDRLTILRTILSEVEGFAQSKKYFSED